ncbi:hypothetical protein [Exiguobacterium flavidum]|uniref:hypothetical protein n=1 Tax=Exiguobacterium flavidum TaxID=2184695 RepID=UPI000DF73BE0|nr:hypothetical protein [Exiguobacterium flavidum]
MKRIHFLYMGILFLIAGGILYSLERIVAHIHWTALVGTGEYPQFPPLEPFTQNLFLPLFLVVGIILLIIGSRRTD